MSRFAFIFFLFSLLTIAAFSQKKDTLAYYVNDAGRIVAQKDSSEYILMILPPDTAVDKNLSIVKGYYPDGKLKFITGSSTHNLPLLFQGDYMEFYRNGRKKKLSHYEGGRKTGDVIAFYPSGRFYDEKSYIDANTYPPAMNYINMRDSTGKVLADNGNGYWIEYHKNFEGVAEEGKIRNGLKDSVWTVWGPDSTGRFETYNNGKLVDMKLFGISGGKVFIGKLPEYPGGLNAFYKFLGENIVYPDAARRNGIQGRVILTFIVEKDGGLSDIKVEHGIGSGCDEEAVKVLQLSPKWIPAVLRGKPVRTEYTIPLSFTLSD